MRIALMGGVRGFAQPIAATGRRGLICASRSCRSRRSRRTARSSGTRRPPRRRGRPGRRPRARARDWKQHGVVLEDPRRTRIVDHAGGTAELVEIGCRSKGRTAATSSGSTGWPSRQGCSGIPTAGAFVPDRWLGDGDRVQVGGWNSRSGIAGHTPGTWCSTRPATGWHSSATCCSPVRSAAISPGGDYDTLIDSIRNRLFRWATTCGSCPGTARRRRSAKERPHQSVRRRRRRRAAALSAAQGSLRRRQRRPGDRLSFSTSCRPTRRSRACASSLRRSSWCS